MTALAARLGVRAPSLYHHLRDKDALWESIRALIATEIDAEVFDVAPWDVALEVWARSYRDAFVRHPHAVADLFTRPVSNPMSFAMYESACRGLHAGGWPIDALASVIGAVEYVISGSVLDLQAKGDMFERAHDNGAALLAQSIRADASYREAADRSFDLALGGLLAGLRTRLAEIERAA